MQLLELNKLKVDTKEKQYKDFMQTLDKRHTKLQQIYQEHVKPDDMIKNEKANRICGDESESLIYKLDRNQERKHERDIKMLKEIYQYNKLNSRSKKNSLSESPSIIAKPYSVMSSPPQVKLKAFDYNPISNPIPDLTQNPYLRRSIEKMYKSK